MDKKLTQIARRYHETCKKAYNRHCTGLDRRGNKVPANKAEANRVRQIQRFELQWIKDVYSFEGISKGDIHRAIKMYRSCL